jgi:hypothetical protein
MRPRLAVLALVLIACATDKPPATDSGPAKTDSGSVAGEAGGAAEASGAEAGPEPGGACQADADCVPATCCHPTSCVIASEAPDCAAVSCTDQCEDGTLDCGQGHCACQNGSCTAVIDGGGW